MYFATPNATTPNVFTEVISQLEDLAHNDGSASEDDKYPGKDGRLRPDMPDDMEERDHSASGDLSIDSSSGDLKIDSQMAGSGHNDGSGRFRRSSDNDQTASSGDANLIRTADETEDSRGSGIRVGRSAEIFSGELPIVSQREDESREDGSGARLGRSAEDHSGDSGRLFPIKTGGSGDRYRRSEEDHSGDSRPIIIDNRMVEGSGVRLRREDRSSYSGDSRLSPIDNVEMEDGSARLAKSAETREPASGDSLLEMPQF